MMDDISSRIIRILKKRRVLGLPIVLVAVVAILWSLEYIDVDTAVLTGTGLTAMVPLAFAATGECINQKAGVINIGLEGIFLITALMGVYGAELFGSWIGGLLFGIGIGAFIGLLFGLISVYMRGGQIIAGMGINIFALGTVSFLLMAIWGQAGQYTPHGKELFVPMMSTPLGLLSPLVLVAIAAAILAHVLLHKTLLGVKIRAAGEKPESADVAGIGVNRTRILTCVFGAALCGLGGAFMSLTWLHTVGKEMVAGYGFIALACVVFAGLEPLLALGAAFIFGLTRALDPWIAIMPGVKWATLQSIVPYIVILIFVLIIVGMKWHYLKRIAPYITILALFTGVLATGISMEYLLRTTPYFAVLVALVVVGERLFPRGLGKPYTRE